MSEYFRDWWLYAPLHFNAPSIICPDVLMEDKKMRFKKEFMGTFRSEKMFRVNDSKNEIPFNRVLADEDTIDDTVDWLNENIKEKEKSFDEIVMEVIDVLWDSDVINISKNGDEYVIHELETSCITPTTIKAMLPDGFAVYDAVITCGRSVFVIQEKK